METNGSFSDKANTTKRLQKHTKKITAIACADVASVIFVKVLRIVSMIAFNTFGVSFQNLSGDTVANSMLNLFHNLLQDL